MNAQQVREEHLIGRECVRRFFRIATILVGVLPLLPLRVLVFEAGHLRPMVTFGLYYWEAVTVVFLVVTGQVLRHMLSGRHQYIEASIVLFITSLAAAYLLLFLITSMGTMIPVFDLPPIADYEHLGVLSGLVFVPVLGVGSILLVSIVVLIDVLKNL